MSFRLALRPLPLLAVLLSTPAVGGELVLSNGDRLSGELSKIDGASLVWVSDLFGELTVDTAAVQTLSSTTRLSELQYRDEILQNCQVAVYQGAMELDCAASSAPVAVAADALPTPPVDSMASSRGTTGELKVAWSKQSGNTDAASLDTSIAAEWENEIAVQSLTAEGDREESNSITTKEQYELDYQADFPVAGNWVSFGHAGYQQDRFASEERRYELGGGFGYRPMLHPDVKLEFDLGSDYVLREFQNGTDDTGFAGRWSFDSQWKTGLLELTLFHKHSYSWPFSNSGSYQLKTATGMKVPLMESLFAELRYDFDRQGEPQPGTEASDREWVFSLGYGW